VSGVAGIEHPRTVGSRTRGLRRLLAALALCLLALPAGPALAQRREAPAPESDLVTLDFDDVELSVVIDTIARMTNTNFIYDDRVRGRVTIVSPTPMLVDQAYAVFESVLQVKGFTTIATPGGAIKVVPVREAKESSIETVQSSRRPPNRDRFVTRLIPLNYIDAESIVNTLKPLVSKDAAMAAYAPTNTVILTESASNIRRLIAILESIDVETYKEELAVVNVKHADARTLAEQISEIYGAEVSLTSTSASRRAPSSTRRRTSATEPTPSPTRPPVLVVCAFSTAQVKWLRLSSTRTPTSGVMRRSERSAMATRTKPPRGIHLLDTVSGPTVSHLPSHSMNGVWSSV